MLDENTVSVTAIDPLDVIVIRAPDFELSPATEPLGGTCTHERSVKERYLGADTGDRKCLGCGAIINIWREVVD